MNLDDIDLLPVEQQERAARARAQDPRAERLAAALLKFEAACEGHDWTKTGVIMFSVMEHPDHPHEGDTTTVCVPVDSATDVVVEVIKQGGSPIDAVTVLADQMAVNASRDPDAITRLDPSRVMYGIGMLAQAEMTAVAVPDTPEELFNPAPPEPPVHTHIRLVQVVLRSGDQWMLLRRRDREPLLGLQHCDDAEPVQAEIARGLGRIVQCFTPDRVPLAKGES